MMATSLMTAWADVDPNFYIYLCFGQSNMEGAAKADAVDKSGIDSRFKMLATCAFDSPKREVGKWYSPIPPIVNSMASLGLGPTDYFGRTMVAALPANVKVGVVAVAMGGSPIEMFDKDQNEKLIKEKSSEWWAQITNRCYGGNAYKRLIDMAKEAQKVGIIKGILLHQGCSNNGQSDWPKKVKKIYNDMLTDLGLSADSVPLFAGETLRQEYGGSCYGHNAVIAKLPSVIPTAHVISSESLAGNGQDTWHFSTASYRILGRRYAETALKLMGLELKADSSYQMSASNKKFFCVKSLTIPEVAVPAQDITVTATYLDGHKEDVSAQTALSFTDGDLAFVDGKLSPKNVGKGTLEAVHNDFSRQDVKATGELEVSYFPLNTKGLTVFTGKPTFDAATQTITYPAASGMMGWDYTNGADFSDYKYLVVRLNEPQTCGATFKINAPKNTSQGFSKSIGTAVSLVVDLTNLKYSGKTINPAKIGRIAFYASKKGAISIKDLILTNDEEFVTGISTIDAAPSKPQDIYNLQGIKVGCSSQSDQLPHGIFIINGKLTRR